MLSAQSAEKCQLFAFSPFATSHRLGSLLAPITLPLPLTHTRAPLLNPAPRPAHEKPGWRQLLSTDVILTFHQIASVLVLRLILILKVFCIRATTGSLRQ